MTLITSLFRNQQLSYLRNVRQRLGRRKDYSMHNQKGKYFLEEENTMQVLAVFSHFLFLLNNKSILGAYC